MWRDWSGHLGVEDPDGMAQFIRTGYLGFCTPGYDSATVLALWDEFGIPYELLDGGELRRRWSGLDVGQYWPPKRIDDPAFSEDATSELTAFYEDVSGYIDDPMLAAHNLAHAARHHGAEFRFRRTVTGDRADRRAGVGRRPRRRRDVGGAGRDQRRRAALARRQRDGRRHRRHAHRPPAAAPGGLRRAGAGRASASTTAARSSPTSTSASTSGRRPAARCSSVAPSRSATSWSGSTTPMTSASSRRSSGGRRRCSGSPGGCRRSACRHGRSGWPRCTTPPTTGCRSTTARASTGYFMACGTSGNQFKNAPLAGQFIRALVDAADGRDRPRRRAGAVHRPD